jgi:hypothetical protein
MEIMSKNVREITGTLENWSVQKYGKTSFIVWGNLNGDVRTRWSEGQFIHTSNVVGVSSDDIKEGDTIQTLNSVYKLGEEAHSEG